MSDTAVPVHQATREPGMTDRQRGCRAQLGGMLGYFVDQFDIYLPVVALAPAMSYFQPATPDPGTSGCRFADRPRRSDRTGNPRQRHLTIIR
ncbi:hypothetical protein ACWDKQ_28760 [Saccharopolyspora sp. NPDC000995]